MKWVKITFVFAIIWVLYNYTLGKANTLGDNIYYIFNATFHLLCIISIQQLLNDRVWKRNLRLLSVFFGVKLATLITIILFTKARVINEWWAVMILFLVLVTILSLMGYTKTLSYSKKRKKWLL